jgi:hypothetical protein
MQQETLTLARQRSLRPQKARGVLASAATAMGATRHCLLHPAAVNLERMKRRRCGAARTPGRRGVRGGSENWRSGRVRAGCRRC